MENHDFNIKSVNFLLFTGNTCFINFYVLGTSKKHSNSLGIQYIFNNGWTKP